MAIVRMTQARQIIGVLFAIVVLVLAAVFADVKLGWNVSVLDSIAKALGIM